MERTNINKANENYGKARIIFASIAAAIGVLSYLFLLTYGIDYGTATVSYYYSASDISMAHLIFGNSFAGVNPGLLSAFIIMTLAIILDLAMIKNNFCGYLSFLFFLTAGILFFCTVPLYGNMSAKLSTGGWCLGVFNIVDAVLVFLG